MYALPYDLYKEHGIRRYGAHGSSHLFIVRQAAKWLKKSKDELIQKAFDLAESSTPRQHEQRSKKLIELGMPKSKEWTEKGIMLSQKLNSKDELDAWKLWNPLRRTEEELRHSLSFFAKFFFYCKRHKI